MQQVKKFIAKNGCIILIRPLVLTDLKRAKDITDFFNSIVAEKDFIAFKKKKTVEEEIRFIKKYIENPEKDYFCLIAECNNKIIGTAGLDRMPEVSAVFVLIVSAVESEGELLPHHIHSAFDGVGINVFVAPINALLIVAVL